MCLLCLNTKKQRQCYCSKTYITLWFILQCFIINLIVFISSVLTANGTAGSQLSTPRSGKSPSPSPTSPASLRRRQVIKIDVPVNESSLNNKSILIKYSDWEMFCEPTLDIHWPYYLFLLHSNVTGILLLFIFLKGKSVYVCRCKSAHTRCFWFLEHHHVPSVSTYCLYILWSFRAILWMMSSVLQQHIFAVQVLRLQRTVNSGAKSSCQWCHH